MKKIALIAALSVCMTAASAMELGVHANRVGGRDTNTAGMTGMGLSVGFVKDSMGLELAVDRQNVGPADVTTRYSVVGTYELMRGIGGQLDARLGGSYIDPTGTDAGYAMQVGLGYRFPITKQWVVAADVMHQRGQARVEQFNGNQVSVGVKYAF